MSDFGVYDDEMLNNRFSDQDVERLLSGGMPEDEDLADLAPILEALHGGARRPLPEERIARFAAQAAEIATSTRPTAVPVRTTTRSRRFVLALRQRMATGLAAALLLSGMTGVAVASNHAAPGDALYGLDRALEGIGIGDGKAAERVDEAQTLFASGRVADAISHAAEAVEDTEGDVEVLSPEASNASSALRDAAANVADGEDADTQSQDVRDEVASMLMWMAEQLDPELTAEFDGKAFGEGVATRAKMIAGAPDELPDTADEAADAGADNAENAAEESEDAPPEDAPPEDVPSGPPDSVPPSDTTGRP